MLLISKGVVQQMDPEKKCHTHHMLISVTRDNPDTGAITPVAECVFFWMGMPIFYVLKQDLTRYMSGVPRQSWQDQLYK